MILEHSLEISLMEAVGEGEKYFYCYFSERLKKRNRNKFIYQQINDRNKYRAQVSWQHILLSPFKHFFLYFMYVWLSSHFTQYIPASNINSTTLNVKEMIWLGLNLICKNTVNQSSPLIIIIQRQVDCWLPIRCDFISVNTGI